MGELLGLKSKANLNCILCDKCCEYRGDIKLTPINVLQISKYLKISIEEFFSKYTKEVASAEPEIVIKGIGPKQECIFNDRKNYKCKIHKVRPMQCVMFPLRPVDIKNDVFENSCECVVKTDKFVTVNKWINTEKLYSKNKEIYLKWIELMEKLQPKWDEFSNQDKEKIKNILYKKYDLKKNLKRQVLENINLVFANYNL